MKHLTGDLLEMGKNGDFDIIVHGCNCLNTMGSGIARQIREQLPDAWLADQETVKGNKDKLGTYTVGVHGKLIIVNAYTQYAYNVSGFTEDQFEYESFQTILDKLAVRWGCARFGFPLIGMGLAGGDKERIMSLLEEFSAKVEAQGGSVALVEFGK